MTAIGQAVWVNRLILEYFPFGLPLGIVTDCKSFKEAACTANVTSEKRTSIEISSVREDLANKTIRRAMHIPSHRNYADALTKPKPDVPLSRVHAMIGSGHMPLIDGE